jgi:voltage-gated potassium channel
MRGEEAGAGAETGLRGRLREMLEDVNSPAGRRFALLLQALILLSVVSISLDTFAGLPHGLRQLLHVLDIAIILFFSVEYLLRVWVARRRLAYVLSFWGLIDLAAVAPFWIVGADARAVRAFRLLRIVHIFRFGRYAKALEHFGRAWNVVREDIQMFLGMSGILLYLAALGIWHFEHDAQPQAFGDIFDALWWAMITLTTVGYGDIYPVTTGGRIFTMLLLLVGLALVAVPSGLLATAFTEVRRQEREAGRGADDRPEETLTKRGTSPEASQEPSHAGGQKDPRGQGPGA